MKKTISTNISGILFHIEEDGYDILRKYLDSINLYFSTYEDNKEIIADIESRIAEIFTGKLNVSKQVITSEDVTALIRTMGSVNDFKAAEEADGKSEPFQESAKYSHGGETRTKEKLYRDKSRKLLGGVAAGFGRYLHVDPIWIRLFILAFFLGLWFIHSMTFITLVAYVAFWILLPEKSFGEEDIKTKKLFRNPDDRIISGMCSGLAAYFKLETNLVRAIFVISIFLGGAGLILYILLWIIVPPAKTLTDRMQMEGAPVTLSNIVDNIKKELNIKEGENEHLLIRILLAPFRLLSRLLELSQGTARPLFIGIGEVFRIGVGLGLLAVPLLISIFVGGCLLILTASFPGYEWLAEDLYPVNLFFQNIPKLVVISLAALILVPLISVSLTGAAILSRRNVFHRSIGWSLTALFFISLAFVILAVPSYISNFRKKGGYEKTASVHATGKILVLRAIENTKAQNSKIQFRIIGTSDSTVKVVTFFSARGKTRHEAVVHAKSINYELNIEDSTIAFGTGFTLEKINKTDFRNQELHLNLYLPMNQKVQLDESMTDLLPANYFDNNSRNNLWVYENDKMICLTCADKNKEVNTMVKGWNNYFNENNDFFDDFDFESDSDLSEFNLNQKSFNFKDFSGIEANGNLNISVRKGDAFEVEASGNETALQNLDMYVEGNKLKITFEKNERWWKKFNNIKINIICPHLESLDLSGATRSSVSGFEESKFEANLSGASYASLDINTNKFRLDSRGASKIELEGVCDEAYLTLKGASGYSGYDFKIRNADLHISGASSTKIFATEELKIDAAGVSKVRYKGHPHIIKSVSGLGKISEEEN